MSGHTYQPARSPSAGPESGFQSSASLTSLLGPMYERPIKALNNSYMNSDVRNSSESLVSLTSGLSSLYLPEVSGRRSSLTKCDMSGRHPVSKHSDQTSGRQSVFSDSRSRVSLGRRSESQVQFAQYRPAQWFLKPIFHEVPQREAGGLFVGRKWLWGEMVDRMRDSRGLLILGAPGSGKTAISLQLVQSSCFGVSQGGHGERG